METAMSSESERAHDLHQRVSAFMQAHVYPAEALIEAWDSDAAKRWQICPLIEELKRKAQAEGLWNLFLPDTTHGAGLSNRDYAPLAELLGRSLIATELFNRSEERRVGKGWVRPCRSRWSP